MTRLSAIELPTMSPAAAVRVVRGLGANRYVARRAHLVHAFALASAEPNEALREAHEWAKGVLSDPSIDRDSKDPRLFREASDKELVATLAAFWDEDALASRSNSRERLAALLGSIGIAPENGPLFDESTEEDVYPVLVDATWELLKVAELDPERHRGLVETYEPIELSAERFEEESAIPPREYLFELPLLGPKELLLPTDEWGDLRSPFVVWSSAPATYEDYLVRGVLKAAKIVTEL